MIKLKNIINNRGFILPTAMMLGAIGMLLTLVPFTNLVNREIRLDHRIAKTKARLNAESGLANVYSYFSLDSLGLDSMSLGEESFSIDYTTFRDPALISNDMGFYRDIILQESLNPLSRRTERNAFAVGEANITSFGKNISVLDTMAMSFELESLSEYLYLTNHEHAGGAPGIYGTDNCDSDGDGETSTFRKWRGKPCFSPTADGIGNDISVAGYVQTNDPMIFCSPCSQWDPPFTNTVYFTIADEDYQNSDFNVSDAEPGEIVAPMLGGGLNSQNCFGGTDGPDEHPYYIEKEKVCFPMKGYWSTVGAAKATFDSSALLEKSRTGNGFDKLIMTDIEFLSSGGAIVKRYWYFMPPYLKSTVLDPNGTGDLTLPSNAGGIQRAEYLEGVICSGGDCLDGGVTNAQCDGGDFLITSCNQYNESMRAFHAKQVTDEGNFTGNSYVERYRMTWDDPAGYNVDNYNQGIPGNYGPTDPYTTEREDPNGYGVTNLSHYDPHNFWEYFGGTGNQNNTWARATYKFGLTGVNPALIDDPTGLYNGTQIDETLIPWTEGVIYVKGGPVTVHGTYNGRYTVVTSGWDEKGNDPSAQYEGWSTYYRNAWPTANNTHGRALNGTTLENLGYNGLGTPIDTIYSNIWITGDLINADAPFGGPPQPVVDADNNGENDCALGQPGDCGGSANVLGLVSAANVIIANSPDNRNGVKIHASIVAFHESFVMHYWQTTAQNAGGANFNTLPITDTRGKTIYNSGNGTNGDYRGTLTLWGGIIQNYRGYMKRYATGPYPVPGSTNAIGMAKDYYFDQNLAFPPPYFPYISRCPDEGAATAAMTMISYQPVTSEIKAIYESVD